MWPWLLALWLWWTPMPTNTTAGTAQDLGAFPFTYNQTNSPAEAVLWYKFTAPALDVIGLRITSNNNNHDFDMYSDAGVTRYMSTAEGGGEIEGQNQPFQMPVLTPGGTYWIRAFNLVSGGVTSLTLTGYALPNDALDEYAVVVPDDAHNFPAVVLHPTTGAVQNYIPAIPASEVGASLPNGYSLSWARSTNSGVPTGDATAAILLNRTAVVATITGLFDSAGRQPQIRENAATNTFWTMQANASDTSLTIKQVSLTGAVLQTIGPITLSPSIPNLMGFSVNRAETIAYLYQFASAEPIRRLDLNTETFLSNLVAGAAGVVPNSPGDTIVLPDDSVLVPFYISASDRDEVRRYSAAGALQATYVLRTAGTRVYNHLADAHDDGVSFWAWLFDADGDGNATGLFRRIRVSDGATLAEFTSYEFNIGQGPSNGTAVSTVSSGHSNSCPFWILTAPAPPPALPTPGSQIDNSTPCCADKCGCDGGSEPGNAGPVEPSISTNWYRRCTGGGAVATATDVVDDEDWSVESPPKEPDSWLTIAGDSSSPAEDAERWGLKPLSDDGRFVAGRLEEVGSIERRSSDKDGHYPPARMRAVAQDDDGVFRARLDDINQRDFINREAKYELCSYAGRKAGLTPLPLIQGRIVEIEPALDRKAVIEVQDIVGAQGGVLDAEKLIGVPIGDEHPAKPETTKGKIYPIILGEHSDAGAIDATGADASMGMLPGIDCGDAFFPDETPDPDGRTFNEALTPVTDKADVNLSGSPSGDITYPTRVLVAPIIAGEMGPPSDVPTGFLDDYGNGLGGPSDPHAHRAVWMDITGGADDYIAWFFTVPGWHPITNPTGDTNVRYKIVSGTPSMPSWPPRNGGVGPQWDFYVDFANLADGDQWGVQSASPPQNLAHAVGSPAGTTRYVFAVSAITALGESRRSTAVIVDDGPAVLSPTDPIELTWDPPADHPEAVIAYRVIGRTQAGLVNYLAIVGLNESPIPTSYTDDGHDVEKPFNAGTGALVSENVWAWIVCAGGDGTVDIHTVYGSDGAEGTEPKRVALGWNDGTICGPESDGWPHDAPYRIVGGIRQSGFYARGLPLKHHREGVVTFAWNGCGYSDASGSPTRVIDQAYRMLQLVLNEFVEKNNGEGYRDGDFGPIETFTDGTPKFWTSKFEATQDQTKLWLDDDLGYVGAIAIVDPITTGEFLRRFFVTFGGHLTSNHRGSLYPYVVVPSPDSPPVGRLFRERMEIMRLDAHWFAKDERENRITYAYHYNFDQQTFRNEDITVEDAVSIAAHGGDRLGVYKADVKDCFYGNDATTMADRWQRHLDLYAYAPRYVTWVTNLRAIPDHNGDPIRFSHRKEGLGATGETATPGVLQHTVVTVKPYEIRQTVMLFRA